MFRKQQGLAREFKTLQIMVALYCRGEHGTENGLCTECSELVDYGWERMDKCPFQKKKTACSKCTVHCYKPEMRQRVRTVMKYSGRRMVHRHPIMTFFHLVASMRKHPVRSSRKAEGV